MLPAGVFAALVLASLSAASIIPFEFKKLPSKQLSSYDGKAALRLDRRKGGAYEFHLNLPDHRRSEKRNEEGEVEGSFAFVDPVGEEVSLEYKADKEGFRAESNALPKAPSDTDEVMKARQEFMDFYQKTVEYLKALSHEESDEDSGESSEESDQEEDESSSEEDDDEYEDEEESDEDEDEKKK